MTTIEITAYLKKLVRQYQDCGCDLCTINLARYVANKVQEKINYREE